MLERILEFLAFSGFANLYWGNVVIIALGGILITLGIWKRYEPLLLIPIGFGMILANLPIAGLMAPASGTEPAGLLYYLNQGVTLVIFPPLIFLGIGALSDFTPILANPKTFFMAAGAQLGIFIALFLALTLGFDLSEAGAIGIIGGADGPPAVYTSAMLASHLLGPIAIAAYSYMALVPIIQTPIIRLITTKEERAIVMEDPREVSQIERILFPIVALLLIVLILPKSAPLIGMLMFGNFLRECGVVERLAKTAGNELLNIVTIFLCICVGAAMEAHAVLNLETMYIFALGIFAFMCGTTGGLLIGKLLHRLTRGKINPLIGAAGVSAVPMAARVCHAEGQKANPRNFLLPHAMGPNIGGVIASATCAGILIAFLG